MPMSIDELGQVLVQADRCKVRTGQFCQAQVPPVLGLQLLLKRETRPVPAAEISPRSSRALLPCTSESPY